MGHSDSMKKMQSWPTETGTVLLPIARTAIEHVLVKGSNSYEAPGNLPEWVHQTGACFVTLTQNNALRGCIGTLLPHRSLLEDVKGNAVMAATQDPRFTRLSLSDLPELSIELSVLSAMEKLAWMPEEALIKVLRPGIDGLVLECRGRHSTFLPQVWEQLPDPVEFLKYLKNKAGLGSNFWAEDLMISRYTVSKWSER